MTPLEEKERIAYLKKTAKENIKDPNIVKAISGIIEKMPDLNNKIQNLNLGGCGIFALMLWDKLKELGLGDKVKAYPFLLRSPWGVPDVELANRQFISASQNDSISVPDFNHIIIALQDEDRVVLVDSDTFSITNTNKIVGEWVDSIEMIGEPLDYNVLLNLVTKDDSNHWNLTYDRTQDTKLKEIIDSIVPSEI